MRPYVVVHHYVDQETGKLVDDRDWWGLGWFVQRSEVATPISAMLSRHAVGGALRLALANDNDYYLLGGHGCGLGQGSNASSNARDVQMAAVLDAMYLYRPRAEAELWRMRLLDAETAMKAEMALLAEGPEVLQFGSRAEFEAWWRASGSAAEARFSR